MPNKITTSYFLDTLNTLKMVPTQDCKIVVNFFCWLHLYKVIYFNIITVIFYIYDEVAFHQSTFYNYCDSMMHFFLLNNNSNIINIIKPAILVGAITWLKYLHLNSLLVSMFSPYKHVYL